MIAAVMARVVTDVPGTTWAEGERELSRHQAPPSVVWRRIAATPGRAAQRDDAIRSYDRAILGLDQQYAVRVWGVDLAQLDALRVALVRALEHEAAGQYEYQGDTQADVGVLSLGEAVVARIVLGCHVPSRPVTTVAVTTASVARNPAAASDDGILTPGD